MKKKTIRYILAAGIVAFGVGAYLKTKSSDKVEEQPVEETLIVDDSTQQ